MSRTNNWRRVLIPLLWIGLIIPWTWALLVPIPGSTVERVGGPDMSFAISKTLHGGVYAILAIITLSLPLPRMWRFVLLGLLIAHGGITEYFQQFVERHSSWRDFARDTAGVLAGAGLFWLARRYLRRVPPQIDLEPERGGEHRDAAHLR